jgi:uncharacterized protein
LRTKLPARWFEAKTALITDASSAIGQAFAEALARRGTHLILVARSAEQLHVPAVALSRLHAVSVEVIAADLTQAGAAQHLCVAVEQMNSRVDVLVTSADFGLPGRCETLPPARDSQHVLRNALAVVDLTHAFLPAMLARGRGVVVTVTSAAESQPLPHLAVYGATQAFLLSFSQALWAACRSRGVSVLAVCPVAPDLAFSAARRPERVVASALRALERQQSSVGPGWFNKLLVRIRGRFLPRNAQEFKGLQLELALVSPHRAAPACGEHRRT